MDFRTERSRVGRVESKLSFGKPRPLLSRLGEDVMNEELPKLIDEAYDKAGPEKSYHHFAGCKLRDLQLVRRLQDSCRTRTTTHDASETRD